MVRNAIEYLFGKYYEGPEPPERLDRMVMVFANTNRYATRAEWQAFAAAHAREAYRAGYVRGEEWSERAPDRLPDVPPETLANQIDPDWKWRPMGSDVLEFPNDRVAEENLATAEQMLRGIEEAKRFRHE
jgi:hypothetical protein